MQLGLLSFNKISENWEGNNDIQYYYKDGYMKFCFYNCEDQQGTVLDKDKLINGPYFRSVFSCVGRFLIWPVDIQLLENAVPLQKPSLMCTSFTQGKVWRWDLLNGMTRYHF